MREYNESFNENILTLTKNQDLLDFGGILHSGVEIVFLYGGETRVWVGNKSVETAKAGDAIIIFPNQQYRYESAQKEDCELLIIDIRRLGSELLGVFSSYSPKKNVINGGARNKELCELLKSIEAAYGEKRGKYRETVLKGYATAFLGRLLPMLELKKNAIEEANTLSEIINYCNTRYKEKISLEAMERELHISKYYISHVINEKIGKGFNEYVNSIRINEACRLLLESELTVKEISEKVGFGTVRSFDRAFKKQKNETAKEYRARNCDKIKKD